MEALNGFWFEAELLYLKLRRHFCYLKAEITESLSRVFFNRVLAPESEILCKNHPWFLPFGFIPNLLPADLSFAPPKESIQRKGGPLLRSPCAPRFCRGSAERASCPPADVRHPCRTPFGLFPIKPAVLGAVKRGVSRLLFNFSCLKSYD